jgi:hypothetical protein
MGYHVRIINTAKDTAASEKMLNRPQDLAAWLRKNFDFYADTDDSGQQYFYRADDQERTLFYEVCDEGNRELLAIGPDDTLLALMIDIARLLGDGSNEGETYVSPVRSYTHPDDAATLAAVYGHNSLGRKLFDFLLSIWIPLLLWLIVFLFKLWKE